MKLLEDLKIGQCSGFCSILEMIRDGLVFEVRVYPEGMPSAQVLWFSGSRVDMLTGLQVWKFTGLQVHRLNVHTIAGLKVQVRELMLALSR